MCTRSDTPDEAPNVSPSSSRINNDAIELPATQTLQQEREQNLNLPLRVRVTMCSNLTAPKKTEGLPLRAKSETTAARTRRRTRANELSSNQASEPASEWKLIKVEAPSPSKAPDVLLSAAPVNDDPATQTSQKAEPFSKLPFKDRARIWNDLADFRKTKEGRELAGNSEIQSRTRVKIIENEEVPIELVSNWRLIQMSQQKSDEKSETE